MGGTRNELGYRHCVEFVDYCVSESHILVSVKVEKEVAQTGPVPPLLAVRAIDRIFKRK